MTNRVALLKAAKESGLVRFEGGDAETYGIGKANENDFNIAYWSNATEAKLTQFFKLMEANNND